MTLPDDVFGDEADALGVGEEGPTDVVGRPARIGNIGMAASGDLVREAANASRVGQEAEGEFPFALPPSVHGHRWVVGPDKPFVSGGGVFVMAHEGAKA